MTIKSILNCEKKILSEINKYQLPNYFKNIGIGLFILSFVALLANGFSINDTTIKTICKYSMLIGLLLTSISKEKIEDELIIKLRMQSYSFAFIVGVIFALLLPAIDYLIDYISKNGVVIFKDLGDWVILWILLSVQVFYFSFLKKLHK